MRLSQTTSQTQVWPSRAVGSGSLVGGHGAKTEGRSPDICGGIEESRCPKPLRKANGIDQLQRVTEVSERKQRAPPAVAAPEHSARTQHPPGLLQQPVLQLTGRYVVQHRETQHHVKGGVTEGQCRRVTVIDVDVGKAST